MVAFDVKQPLDWASLGAFLISLIILITWSRKIYKADLHKVMSSGWPLSANLFAVAALILALASRYNKKYTSGEKKGQVAKLQDDGSKISWIFGIVGVIVWGLTALRHRASKNAAPIHKMFYNIATLVFLFSTVAAWGFPIDSKKKH